MFKPKYPRVFLALLLFVVVLKCDKPQAIGDEPRAQVPTPASQLGSDIRFRTIDPAMNQNEEFALLRLLQQPWGRGFHCSTLQQLVTELNRRVPACLNKYSLEEVGLQPDEEIDLQVSCAESPHATLNRVSQPFGLSWSIRSGRVVIETHEVAEMVPITRVYDVTPIVVAGTTNDGPIRGRADFTSLQDFIQCSISPETWAALGGPSEICEIVVRGRCMIAISTTYTTHLQIKTLLHSINELGADRTRLVRDRREERKIAKPSLPRFGD